MEHSIHIGSRRIGPGSPVYVIAELSANHNQSFEQAVHIIQAAKGVGADAVKLQTYTADTITLRSNKEYFRISGGTLWDGRILHDLYQEAFTPWEWQPKLKQAAEDLLPREIIYRKKMGFPTPWDFWLAGSKLDELERTLLEPRSMERGIFRPGVVKRIFAEHRAKARDHGNRIWRLLNLELWMRVMIDGEPAEDVAAHGQSRVVAQGGGRKTP